MAELIGGIEPPRRVKIAGHTTTQTKISVNALGTDPFQFRGDLLPQLNKSGTVTPNITQAICLYMEARDCYTKHHAGYLSLYGRISTPGP